jgi:hypothetical protein
MTDQDLSREDISAMRREGDLSAFLRQGIRAAQQIHRDSLRPAAPSVPPTPGHTPGAWPVGTSGTDGRKACACTRCRSYAKGQPEHAELLRQTHDYLNGNEGAE